ncbi:universal stress protein [Puia sp. P3]|uniref:universal stress protein n=1 Tax=Puia sp. P3 TaxID=3423952 RepID=UPI003D66D6FE
MPFTKILIAVDDSGESMKAARCGFELAHCLKAVIGVLFVIDKDKEVVSADLGITPNESKNTLREEAERTLDQYIKMYDGIEQVFRFTPEGDPEKEILNIASEWKAELIVMGTHGRSKLDRMMTRSVAEYVIRHAEIPVMVTPTNMK